MEQTYTTIILVFMSILVFTVMAYFEGTNYEKQILKHSLNLSSKVLINNINETHANFEEIAQGYTFFSEKRVPKIDINKEKLMDDFHIMMAKNYGDAVKYKSKITQNLTVKVVADYEKFFVAGVNDKWSAPYFYSYTNRHTNKVYYLNTLYDEGIEADTDTRVSLYTVFNNPHDGTEEIDRYYDESDDSYENKERFEEELHRLKGYYITNRINAIIAKPAYTNGLAIEFASNRASESNRVNNFSQDNFNPLEGITFFVVYKEDKNIFLQNDRYDFKNYNVVGFTLKEYKY
ncbi:MAG: hypothetical protein N4A47_00155 [Clostridia bacterium]|jgi:hypothetical protein|nr:hypothetical protein [Clostridia bacterium]